MNPTWYRRPEDSTLEQLGDAYLCYQYSSAETHLLDLFSGEIFLQIGDSPSTTTELAASMAALCDEPNSEEWLVRVGKVLRNLQTLELVDKRDV